jgi:RHS repeat-associated protein
MADSGGPSNVISLPKGGGALHGIGEKFSPDLHTGSGNFTVPIAIPPGRNGFQPQLSLVYSTGQGNGPFGLGWSLSVPGVSRQTHKGIPRYLDGTVTAEDQDVFILSGAEDLVPVSTPAVTPTFYRPRTEGLFASIARHVDATSDFWEVRSTDGLVSRYGTAEKRGQDPAVVADPSGGLQSRIYSWRLTSTIDPFGNLIEYEYERNSGRAGPHDWDQVYLKTIRYVDYERNGAATFLVSVAFEYEDRDDAFSDYRSGFEIRTTRRCTRITVVTHADADRLVRTYDLIYLDARSDAALAPPLNGASLLSQVVATGVDGSKVASLPPLEFSYTGFDPGQRQFRTLQGTALPATSLANPDLELVDLFGQGLLDILEMSGVVRYWRNLGGGQFDTPRMMATAPGVALSDQGVQLIDANGNGRPDLLVATPLLAGYFPLRFGGLWDSAFFKSYPLAPTFNLKDPQLKLIDLDGDGVTDALRCGVSLECTFNHPTKGWHRTLSVNRSGLAGFPASFADPHVKWSDMSGDGMDDAVIVHDGNVTYWPNLGYGRWGAAVTMLNNPDLPFGYDPARVLLGDVDGDGLADFVYVENNQVTVWINQSGNRWSDPLVIVGTPAVSSADSIRLADVEGVGISGVLWSRDAVSAGSATLFVLDFTGGVKPYVLNEMNNHIGAVTRVAYAPSVRFYLEDQKTATRRWRTVLPFPVQVVARVEVIDEISGGKLTTSYRYSDGYWDGDEREFRGFGMVEQFDTESFADYDGNGLHGPGDFTKVDAAHFSPPMLTRTWFHQGPVGDEVLGGWQEPDGSDAHWIGDPQILDHTGGVNAFLALFPATAEGRATQRDALRTLRGSVLRTELYALDGSSREDRPYTVTEFSYGLIEIDPPAPGDPERRRIFFPHLTSQRTTQWERGDDPQTRFSFSDYTDGAGAGVFDPFGRVLGQTEIACPRGWRTLADTPSESFLATRTRTVYAAPSDPAVYIHTRAATFTSYELANTVGKQVSALKAITDADSSLRIIGQTRNFYDGGAFEGLPLGAIGLFGALTRIEALAFDDAILEQAYGAEIPPYLEPTGNPVWTTEYPAEFRALLPPRAGYVFHAGSVSADDPAGYFVRADRRRYDFHSSPSGMGRGLILEALDPLHDATVDPTAHRTLIGYDTCQTLPETVTDAAGLTIAVAYDYRVLQPRDVTDQNGNTTSFTFTPLGLLESTSVRGKSAIEGDQSRPSVRMEYGFLAFEASVPGHRQPIYVRTIRHVHHDRELDVPLPKRDDTIISVEYSDGFGRLLQTRMQGEDIRVGDQHFGGGEDVLPLDPDDGAGADVVGSQNSDDSAPNVVISGWRIHDNKGHLVEKFEPFFSEGWAYGHPDDSKIGQRITIRYDPLGRAVCTRRPDGSEERVIFGVPGALAAPDPTDPDVFAPTPWESYAYDANDNAGRTHAVESSVYAHHWNTPASTTVDALGRAVEAVERNRDAAASPGGPLPPIQEGRTRTTYDIRGNALTIVDAMGRTALVHTYDFLSRNLRIESLDGGVKTTALSGVGGVLEQRDSKAAVSFHGYDGLSRRIRLWARDSAVMPLTLRQRFEYGDAGDAAQPAGERTANAASNRLGRLVRQFDGAGLIVFDGFDFKGNLLEKTRWVVDDAAILAPFNPPPAGWDVQTFCVDWNDPEDIALDPMSYRSTVTYDALNRAKLMTYPEDVEARRRVLEPHYNRAGGLERVIVQRTTPGNVAVSETFVERIAYNAKGQRVLIAYGNGIMTRHAYDAKTFKLAHVRTEAFDSPAALTYHPLGAPVQDLAYEYDLVGNVLAVTERTVDSGIRGSVAGPDTLNRTFTYDALSRLTSATGRECDVPHATPWDDTPRCVDLTKTRGYSERYVYDIAGNLAQLKHVAGGTSFNRILEFAPGNNRLSIVHIGLSDVAYAYDASGNLTGETTSRHFEWDHADRMRACRTQTDGSEPTLHAHYLYDVDGRRVKKLVRSQGGNVETTVEIDSIFSHHRAVRAGRVEENNTLHVMDTRSRIAEVRVGDALPGDALPAIRYCLTDHLGSISVLIDESGGWINREEYTPYGDTSFGGAARKRYRFGGKPRDGESGLIFVDARYYAPWLGRWLSCDPAGPIDGLNLYVYCSGNPTSLIDPSGAETCKPDVASCAIGPAENPNNAIQSSVAIMEMDSAERMNQENAKALASAAPNPNSKFDLTKAFGEAHKDYQEQLGTPRVLATVPTLGLVDALEHSWERGSTKDKAVLTLTGAGAAAGFIPYWGDYISLGTSVGVLALDPSLSNLGDVGLNAAGAVLPFVPALGTLRKADRVLNVGGAVRAVERTHITYVLKDGPDSIRYVGRAIGDGTAEKVLYDRLVRDHKVFDAHPNLVAEVLAEHRTLEASKGAESVYHDYYKALGHKLLNDPKCPPCGSSSAAIRAKTRDNIGVFFAEW